MLTPRAAGAVALLAVVASTLSPNIAQAQQESASNLSQFSNTRAFVGHSPASNSLAQAATTFTTGRSAQGYQLSRIRIQFIRAQHVGTAGALVAEIRTVTSNRPGALHGTLTCGAVDRIATCTASGIALARQTDYFLVLSAPTSSASASGNAWAASVAASGGQGPITPGWDIGNQLWFKEGSGEWMARDGAAALKFELTADVVGLGITASASTLSINEAGMGSAGEYTLVLNSVPSAQVTVTPTITPAGVATFTPATLTFTRGGDSDWETPQTVTVTASNDNIDNEGDARPATITHISTSDHAAYAINADTNPSVMLTVVDDDEVTAPPPAPAGAPRNVQADVGDTQITVTWTVPSSGGEVTRYDVCIITAPTAINDANCAGAATMPETGTTHTRSGLDADARYNIGVRSVGPGGNSAWVRLGTDTDSALRLKLRVFLESALP